MVLAHNACGNSRASFHCFENLDCVYRNCQFPFFPLHYLFLPFKEEETSETNVINCNKVSSSNEVSLKNIAKKKQQIARKSRFDSSPLTVHSSFSWFRRHRLRFTLRGHNNSNDKQSSRTFKYSKCAAIAVCCALTTIDFTRRLQSTVIKGEARRRRRRKKSSLKSNKIGKQHLHSQSLTPTASKDLLNEKRSKTENLI